MHSCVMHRQKLVGRRFATHDELRAAGLGNPCWRFGARQRGGPAVALIGAAASISAGMAVIGTSALMGGLMIAGGVVSGLGAITGNKTLSTLGMVAGLAGGVGQFFNAGGFDSLTQAYNAGGVSGAVEQFTNPVSSADIITGGLDPASQAMQGVTGAASRGQQILSESMPNIGGADQAFGVRDANGGGLLGDAAARPADSVVTQAPTAQTPTAQAPSGASPLANVPTGALDGKKNTGLLGLWDKQGDFTKMSLINAGAGALKGMGDAETNDKLLDLKASSTDASNKLTLAQAAGQEKKNAGVPMTSVGSFGTNRSAAFGTNPDGTSRTYAEYVADRTAALQRLFGIPQPAVR